MFAALWSFRNELKIVAFAFLLILLMPVIAVIILVNTGINIISDKWKRAFSKLPKNTKLILNADDPQIAFLGINMKSSYYFGLNEKINNLILQHASD